MSENGKESKKMIIKRSLDKEAISKVFNHPQVFPFLPDDISPAFYDPVIHPQVMYLMDEEDRGVVRVDPVNGITCSVHIATTPDMWGDALHFGGFKTHPI